MPADPHAFINEHKGKDIDGMHTLVGLPLISAIVEQVRDGTQVRVRLLLDDHTHQFINLVRDLTSGVSLLTTGAGRCQVSEGVVRPRG